MQNIRRTWHFLSRLIKDKPNSELVIETIAGTIGEGTAYEFKTFVDIFNSLPTFKDILSNPEDIKIPTEPSILYAITAMLAESIDSKNIGNIMSYVTRLPIEFQIITMKQVKNRDPEMYKWKESSSWFLDNQDKFI